MKMTEVDRSIQHADRMEMVISPVLACSHCEDECFMVYVRTVVRFHGEVANDTIFWRDHLPLWEALQALGRWTMAAGGREKERDNARWILEHQGQLW